MDFKTLTDKLQKKRAVIIFDAFFRMGHQFNLSPQHLEKFAELDEIDFIKYYCDLNDEQFNRFLEVEKFLKSNHSGQCLGTNSKGNRCKNSSIAGKRYMGCFPMSPEDIVIVAKNNKFQELFYCENHASQACK